MLMCAGLFCVRVTEWALVMKCMKLRTEPSTCSTSRLILLDLCIPVNENVECSFTLRCRIQ
jgi:hypothetical protein